MPVFRYEAFDKLARVVRGEIGARSMEVAAEALRGGVVGGVPLFVQKMAAEGEPFEPVLPGGEELERVDVPEDAPPPSEETTTTSVDPSDEPRAADQVSQISDDIARGRAEHPEQVAAEARLRQMNDENRRRNRAGRESLTAKQIEAMTRQRRAAAERAAAARSGGQEPVKPVTPSGPPRSEPKPEPPPVTVDELFDLANRVVRTPCPAGFMVHVGPALKTWTMAQTSLAQSAYFLGMAMAMVERGRQDPSAKHPWVLNQPPERKE